ncbi:hypothetical protein yaldo0001_5770 [Yersinia aldovae ATCC 35236]|nr:hypothetical protein yaldo0001_5770 [Yersinia aldovae ATCC 35236]
MHGKAPQGYRHAEVTKSVAGISRLALTKAHDRRHGNHAAGTVALVIISKQW